jgi:hypothetical protein
MCQLQDSDVNQLFGENTIGYRIVVMIASLTLSNQVESLMVSNNWHFILMVDRNSHISPKATYPLSTCRA